MARNQERSAFITIEDDAEQLTGNVCPICCYPTVYEYGLEVCYRCGWFEGCEEINDINI